MGGGETDQYIGTLQSQNGCDSIVTTNLTVNPTYDITENVTICEGASHKGWTEPNTYVENLVSVTGCDSIVTTILKISDAYEITEEKSICQGESYNGWTEANQYTRTLQAQNGCDSIVTTVLTVNPTYYLTENVTICEGASHKGWTEPNTYVENLLSSTGCDSIVTTNLSFYSSYQPKVSIRGDTLISTDSYSFYQWLNMAGEIVGANNVEYIITESGEYYLSVIDENGCTNTSEVVNMVYSTIQLNSFESFKFTIIPNPNRGRFSFRIDSNSKDDLTLKLINSIGQVVEIRAVKSTAPHHAEQFDVSH